MKEHAFVVRTSQDEAGRWWAQAQALPEPLARAIVAKGALPDTDEALQLYRQGKWAVESNWDEIETDAVMKAVRALMARGIGPY